MFHVKFSKHLLKLGHFRGYFTGILSTARYDHLLQYASVVSFYSALGR